jgi:hypothetical protein
MTRKNACFALAILFCTSMAYAQVTGSGTKNTIPLWTGTTSLGNSAILQKGTNVGIGTKTPGAKLDVESTSTTQSAVIGSNNATTGATLGVLGVTASTSTGSIGVLGLANATTGSTAGVLGSAASTGGSGVVGLASAATGGATGVVGSSSSTGGSGMVGLVTAATGITYGVFAESLSATGTGVQGVSPGGQGGAGGGAVVGVSANCGSSTCINTPGNAGIFVTASGGNVLVGDVALSTGWSPVFRVDSTGKGFFDGGEQTGGADFAESVAVAKEITKHEPGDLLIVDTSGKRQLKLSAEPYSTLVAGIYSTKPGVLATPHRMDEIPANEIPLAIVGIVPCKVSAENGSIQPGDLLVASSTPGHAMKGTDRSRMLGAVVGKALEPLNDGKGVIQVLVTLQ